MLANSADSAWASAAWEGALGDPRLPLMLLAIAAVVLAGPAPRLMARFVTFRRCPGPALFVWQTVGVTAVACALLVAPAAVWSLADHPLIFAGAVGLSAAMAALVLWSGHRVGTDLRTLRRRHRDLVDVLSLPAAGTGQATMRILAHPSPTAYCVPGRHSRVVLTEGALRSLTTEEIAAVVAHEQAHLKARHDLILEFFSVLHHAVPPPLRCPAALAEVRLLAEALADRAAIRQVGARPLGHALVALSGGGHPEATLGAATPASTTAIRLELIAAAAERARARSIAMLACAVGIVAAPITLVTWAITVAH